MPDQSLTHWPPDRGRDTGRDAPPVPPGGPVTPMPTALLRGLRNRCPGCGIAPIFRGYLTVTGPCPVCATPLNEARADDAPPYFTILVVGHLVLPTMLLFDALTAPRMWLEVAIWVPVTLALTVFLLRPIKGATIALMLKLDMRKTENEA